MEGEQGEETEKDNDSVYDEKGREELVESGEISSEEAGFMQGYEQADDEEADEVDKDDDEEE
ncbi:hypothetical protein ISS07_04155 [Candidatus Woesearchaeota archaeon]|nr:hypothetical protein [Candidatus Woesearchaeota archaeon]